MRQPAPISLLSGLDARPSAARERFAAMAAVTFLALASYANTLDGALLYDDTAAIVENDWVRQGNALAILTQPSWWGSHTKGHDWRPLTTLSFALNYALHGLHTVGYHAVNVALHAVVSLLVLWVFARLTSWWAAVIAALLFAVHPVHTEAVASVVGRAELLSAAGFFLAWRIFLAADASRAAVTAEPMATARPAASAKPSAAGSRPGGDRHARTAPSPAKVRRRERAALRAPRKSATRAGRFAWRPRPTLLEAAAVSVFAVALLAKATALVLPAVLVLADVLYAPQGRVAATLRARLPRYGALVAVCALFVAARAFVVGGFVLEIPAADNPLVTLPPVARWLTAIRVIGLYAWRLVFPLHLSADYSAWQITPVTSPLDPGFLTGLAILIAVPAAAWWCRRRAPAVALGLGFTALAFAMVSNLLFLVGAIMAERWLYLPSAGFCLVVGALAARLVPDAATPRLWLRVAVPVAVLLALGAARTWTRNRVWRTPESFFGAMVRDAPRSARSHASLGETLAEAGRPHEAVVELERAVAIDTSGAPAFYNLGNTRLALGDVDAAVAAYERALAIEPDSAKVMINLGAAESRRGNTQTAVAWMRRAVALEPRLASLHASIANMLAAAGDEAGAGGEFKVALELAPDSPQILADFGAFLINTQGPDAAIPVLRRALARRTDNPQALYHLGYALLLTGQLDAAIDAFRRAVEIEPTFAEALENLGNAESRRGDHGAALGWMQRAVAIRPASATLHMNIANELFRLGRVDEARAEYEAALGLAPESQAVRTNFGAFLAAQGDDGAAAALTRPPR